jgi:hypothetical protein
MGCGFLYGQEFFSSPQRPDRLSGLHISYRVFFSHGHSCRSMKRTTHFLLVPRSRMYGALHPCLLYAFILFYTRTGDTLRFTGTTELFFSNTAERLPHSVLIVYVGLLFAVQYNGTSNRHSAEGDRRSVIQHKSLYALRHSSHWLSQQALDALLVEFRCLLLCKTDRSPTEATRLRFDQEKKSTTLESLTAEREQVRKIVLWIFRTCSLSAVSDSLNPWRVVIASWSRWWEKRHYELNIRPAGDCKVIFFLIE